MNEGIVGVVALAAIGILCSIASHYFVKNYKSAILLSGFTGAFLFQVVMNIQLKYLDLFAPIVAFISFLMICALSAIIGLCNKKTIKSQE